MNIDAIKEELESLRKPDDAVAMKKYMRDRYNFLGIKSPERRLAFRRIVKAFGYPKDAAILQLCRDLWQEEEREYQYFALDILKARQKALTPDSMDLFEYIIITKSWWDTVDAIATNLVGPLILKYPEQMLWIEKWRISNNIWLRRVTILFQLKYKEKTNHKLLFELINQNLGSKEFFINKAIGWALREYSKTNEAAVRSFVAKTELSNLSAREALKYVNR